jgi:N-ethylmaleimide reductase
MYEQTLLKPLEIGSYDLPNRIFMAPMTRSRADNLENAPTALHALYYSQRATAGLLITEGSQISKQGVGYIKYFGHLQRGSDRGLATSHQGGA